MAIRKIQLVNGEYYHVFNRGVDKRTIFTNKDELYFFFNRLQDLNNTNTSNAFRMCRREKRQNKNLENQTQLVKIVAYCLLPNHFHLLLQQQSDDGISKFMQRLGSSYVKLFNQKHERTGALFQGRFKATHISGDYALPSVSSYVNLNYKHHEINPKEQLVKSSIFEYLGTELGEYICDKEAIDSIINEAGSLEQYKVDTKNSSIHFAENKHVFLTSDDFEF
ncbi:MAG: hypothetical protein Ctma_1034 [Catillopecten margaritatus gill symbiont]|uniref:Transposase IS200-like domain-containing protein n=1 Tax=Catillopecten margaritatus gill symbiont TaxID=3083288 RepID=A0AAU6PH26_9GAMM